MEDGYESLSMQIQVAPDGLAAREYLSWFDRASMADVRRPFLGTIEAATEFIPDVRA